MARRDLFLIGVVVVLIALLLGLASSRRPEQPAGDLRASTLLNGPGGARALWLALDALDVPAERRHAALDAGPPAGPLVLLAPVQPPSPGEVHALMRWLRGGGTLFWAPGPPVFGAPDPTLDSLGVAVRRLAPDSLSPWDAARWEGVTARPAAHPWTAGTPPVEGFTAVFADSSAALEAKQFRTLWIADGGVAAATWRVGKGRVVAFSDAGPLRNAALRESGAAALFARAAAAETGEDEPLVFSEFHQGFGGDGSVGRGLRRFLGGTGPGRALLQLALVAAGLLLLAGRRFGAPLPPPEARRRSPLEHVEALAGAYRQAGARRTARRLLVAGLARRLGRRPPREDEKIDAAVGRMLARLPVARGSAEALEEEWAKGAGGSLVDLAHDVDRLLEEVKRT